MFYDVTVSGFAKCLVFTALSSYLRLNVSCALLCSGGECQIVGDDCHNACGTVLGGTYKQPFSAGVHWKLARMGTPLCLSNIIATTRQTRTGSVPFYRSNTFYNRHAPPPHFPASLLTQICSGRRTVKSIKLHNNRPPHSPQSCLLQ